ncbi:MAG TPA: LuxR C-terminal-related transcriptional regulator [Actinomycetospora sp.]|uniref:LuxR C-terminal-related transcriptional regulator n=1 Tax=Actinomycetospora sp. TaxID=1872135 RepID=UPI002F42A931
MTARVQDEPARLRPDAGPFTAVYRRCFAGIAAFAELDVVAAEEHLLAAVRLARESAGRRSHAARLAGALLGELHHARGEREEAERLLEESGELGSDSGVVDVMVASYALLGRVRAERGERAGATALLVEGDRVAQRLGLPQLRAAVAAERVRLLLATGDVGEARRIVEEIPCGAAEGVGVGAAVERMRTGALAAVLAAEGEHGRAATMLEDAAAAAAAQGQVRAEVEVTVALVGLLEGAGRQLAAERALAGVVGRIAGAGLPGLVADGGPRVRAVLARLAARARAGLLLVGGVRLCPADRLDDLLASAFASRAPVPDVSSGLTARELEILRMLDVGRTNQEIAGELRVTVNTVKWYLKNINTKLGASNRTEAVSLARDRGVLGRARGSTRSCRPVERRHRGEAVRS